MASAVWEIPIEGVSAFELGGKLAKPNAANREATVWEKYLRDIVRSLSMGRDPFYLSANGC
jgi:hypothetical protein